MIKGMVEHLSSAERVRMHKEKAEKELELMHQAIGKGDYKLAMHHKIIANVAIDEMVNVSELVENAGKEKKKDKSL
jgi:hypothetical protein